MNFISLNNKICYAEMKYFRLSDRKSDPSRSEPFSIVFVLGPKHSIIRSQKFRTYRLKQETSKQER